MSYGRSRASAAPKPAGIDANDLATNEKAVAARWFIGPDWCPLTWLISQPLNVEYVEIREKVGKKTQTTGYDIFADVAGLACVGLVDKIEAVELSKEVVWSGSITRPTNPADPNYWRATIPLTGGGTIYFYWGRADQPVDTHVLGPLGALDSTQAHPAYRNQGYAVGQRIPFGSSTSAPSIRLKLRRSPTPEIGAFATQNSVQGESIVAGMLELATNPIFGARMGGSHFTAADWETLSAAVIARAGCFAPSLENDKPLGEVMREWFTLFDGWARIDGGKIVPGYFPHDGQIPASLPEISHHDIVGKPRIGAPSLSMSANQVVVKFRDAAAKLRPDTVKHTARGNARARSRVKPQPVSALPIIIRDQARAYAAETARTGAEGESKGGFAVRRPRAVRLDGSRLRAGDNFQLDWLPYQLDQVSRVAKIVDHYAAAPQIEYVAERGVYPLPYVAPAALQPDLGAPLPTAIQNLRLLELTSELAGTPIGIRIAVLAKRPLAAHENSASVKARNVIGLQLWHSGDDTSYDPLGNQTQWAVRAVLRGAVANAAGTATVAVTLDADNLDTDRLGPISAEDQADDRLLLVMGDEVMSVGNITISGDDWDLSCLRGRQGTLTESGAIDDAVWLVYRDELVSWSHQRFIEDTTRYFKAQPYSGSGAVDLADIDGLQYAFRDRADELPVIAIGALPAAPKVGVSYAVTGSISDVNGDLKSYQVQAVRLVESAGAIDQEITLLAGEPKPDEKALVNWKASLVFPLPGIWQIIVRAHDERVGFKETASAELTVAAGTGLVGPDDGVTPGAVSGVTVTSGIETIILEWTNPTNTPLHRIFIYESETTAKPVSPSFVVEAPQAHYFRNGLPEAATRYYWLEVEATNGRKSAVSGPHSGTVVQWPVISDIESTIDDEVADLTTLADTKKAEAIAAAAADATAKVNTEATARVAGDTAGQSYADAKKSEAISAAAADATAKVNTEATARASADGSLASEYVLATTTEGGGVRRVAGFRVTNLGGAGGSSEFVIQADKFAVVNASGANQRAPFAVEGDQVFIDSAMIRDAQILNAMIEDTLTAKNLVSTFLNASLVRSDVKLYSAEDPSRTFPVVGSVWRGSVVSAASIGALPVHPATPTYYTHDDLILYGWKEGPTGFSAHRFGNSSMRLQATFSGNCNVTAGTYIIYNVAYRLRSNGGAWGSWTGSQHDNYARVGGSGNIQYAAAWDNITVNGDNDIQIGICFSRTSGTTGTIGAVNISAFSHNF